MDLSESQPQRLNIIKLPTDSTQPYAARWTPYIRGKTPTVELSDHPRPTAISWKAWKKLGHRLLRLATAFIHLLDPVYKRIGLESCVGVSGYRGEYS